MAVSLYTLDKKGKRSMPNRPIVSEKEKKEISRLFKEEHESPLTIAAHFKRSVATIYTILHKTGDLAPTIKVIHDKPTPSTIIYIKRHLKEGFTEDQIAQKLKIKKHYVTPFKHEYDVCRYADKRQTIAEITREVHLDPATIYKILRNNGYIIKKIWIKRSKENNHEE
jgi:transposase